MNGAHALTATPEIDSLSDASERAPLSLLAAAALCARNVLLAEHRGDLCALGADIPDDEPPDAVTLAATHVIDHIDDLMGSLVLYESCLRDHLHAQRYRDSPF